MLLLQQVRGFENSVWIVYWVVRGVCFGGIKESEWYNRDRGCNRERVICQSQSGITELGGGYRGGAGSTPSRGTAGSGGGSSGGSRSAKLPPSVPRPLRRCLSLHRHRHHHRGGVVVIVVAVGMDRSHPTKQRG